MLCRVSGWGLIVPGAFMLVISWRTWGRGSGIRLRMAVVQLLAMALLVCGTLLGSWGGVTVTAVGVALWLVGLKHLLKPAGSPRVAR